MSLTKLTKDKFIPFIDVSNTVNTTQWNPEWKQIDLSTIFSLTPNPQTETNDYICYESAVTETTSYQPTLPQEIQLVEGNPVYDFMFEKFYNMEVGAAMTVPVLLCFGGSGKKAWQLRAATVELGDLDTVGGKLNFTLNLGGTREKGTYVITSGVPTFTESLA